MLLWRVLLKVYVNNISTLQEKNIYPHAKIWQLCCSIYLKARLCKKTINGHFVAKIRHVCTINRRKNCTAAIYCSDLNEAVGFIISSGFFFFLANNGIFFPWIGVISRWDGNIWLTRLQGPHFWHSDKMLEKRYELGSEFCEFIVL